MGRGGFRFRGYSAKSQEESLGGPKFQKEFGQHILKNPLIIDSMISKADIQPSDTVLEVGPGTGNITVKLLAVCRKVIAIESDVRLAAELVKRISVNKDHQRKLQLIVGDAIKLSELPYFNVCVSNTPYQISSPLVFKLLAHRPFMRCAVLMFQREFAQRLCAQPNTEFYCRLSVNSQLLAKVTHVMKVSRNNFRPPPQVESSIVKIEPYNPAPPISIPEFDGLLHIIFLRKNKKITSNLKLGNTLRLLLKNYKTYCEISHVERKLSSEKEMKELVDDVVNKCGLKDIRAQKMELNNILRYQYYFY